jgi:hypothetical protein
MFWSGTIVYLRRRHGARKERDVLLKKLFEFGMHVGLVSLIPCACMLGPGWVNCFWLILYLSSDATLQSGRGTMCTRSYKARKRRAGCV